jgi:uncharacterized CHY-type Zn-finger protein
MNETVLQVREIPSWLAEMEFCHLSSDEYASAALCGHVNRSATPHGEYRGEAICAVCGRPNCPRCTQLAAIEDALDEVVSA